MKKVIFILVSIIIFTACSKVVFTGRRQVKLLPNSELTTMAATNYSQFMSENKKSTNASYIKMLNTVGNKMKVAVEAYLKKNGKADMVDNLKWEFNVVENNEVNAWAMPGGKIVFYSGIMPICKDEKGVAVVMGHEIAHVIAQHGNERMSQQMIAQFGGASLSALMQTQPEATQAIYNTAFAVGAQYGAILPFSRLHEKEADKIGQNIMAMAGYDPAYAVDFWKTMNEMSNGQAPMEFMSTHLSYTTRIEVLTNNIEPARKFMK